VLLLTERRDYFFYLYVVGVAGQLWLTLLALLHYPDAAHLEPVPGSDEAAYEARPGAPAPSVLLTACCPLRLAGALPPCQLTGALSSQAARQAVRGGLVVERP